MTVVLFLSFERSFKLLSFMKNVKNVLIPWLYVLEKILLLNKLKPIFFYGAMKNGQILPSNVCHIQYDHKLLFSRKWGTLEVAKG